MVVVGLEMLSLFKSTEGLQKYLMPPLASSEVNSFGHKFVSGVMEIIGRG
jgi:hypothetical protein